MRSIYQRVFVYLILAIASVVAVFPVYYLSMISFQPPAEYYAMPPKWIFTPSLDHYVSVFLKSDFPHFLKNSVIAVLGTLILVMVIGTPAGYALARFPMKYKENFFFFALTTRMGPPVVFALPLFILYMTYGLMDTYLGLFIAYTFYNLAFCIWMTRGFFEDIPREIEEGAMIDGCSHLQAFMKVALPLALPGLAAVAIFAFIQTWNELFYAMILTNINAKTFPAYLPSFVGVRQWILWGEMSAASTVGVIPPLIFAFLVRKQIVRGLTLGAVKG